MLSRNSFAFFNDLGSLFGTRKVIQDDSVIGGQSFGGCGTEASTRRCYQCNFCGHCGNCGAWSENLQLDGLPDEIYADAVLSRACQSAFSRCCWGLEDARNDSDAERCGEPTGTARH